MKTIKINVPKVRNITNSSGREVSNQFIITGDKFTAFQSYDSIIVIKKNGKTYLDCHYWDYSKTTGKYRNQFLGMNKKETENEIKEGRFILAELNS